MNLLIFVFSVSILIHVSVNLCILFTLQFISCNICYLFKFINYWFLNQISCIFLMLIEVTEKLNKACGCIRIVQKNNKEAIILLFWLLDNLNDEKDRNRLTNDQSINCLMLDFLLIWLFKGTLLDLTSFIAIYVYLYQILNHNLNGIS